MVQVGSIAARGASGWRPHAWMHARVIVSATWLSAQVCVGAGVGGCAGGAELIAGLGGYGAGATGASGAEGPAHAEKSTLTTVAHSELAVRKPITV